MTQFIWTRKRDGGQDAIRAYKTAMLDDPCAHCGEPATVLDHIHPASRGGTRHWTNCAGVCELCNSRKSNAPLLTFLARERCRWRGLTDDESHAHDMLDTMWDLGGVEGAREFIKAYDAVIHRAFTSR